MQMGVTCVGGHSKGRFICCHGTSSLILIVILLYHAQYANEKQKESEVSQLKVAKKQDCKCNKKLHLLKNIMLFTCIIAWYSKAIK